MTNYKDHNDLVYAIAKRTLELANLRMPILKGCMYSSATSIKGAQEEFKCWDRGMLIELILLEEFIEEFPREFADE